MQVGQVVQFDVVAKYPLDKRLQKQPLQTIPKRRATKAQGGVDREPALG